ncbi:MAG: hypothetical protein ABIT76_02325 [Chthoniobacterales bacterium]
MIENFLRLIAASIALAVAGCATTQPIAPSVNASMAQNGISLKTLELGRTTFATSCTACHAAQPVAHYTLQEWSGIVDGMAPRAHLDATRKAALMSYLTALKS